MTNKINESISGNTSPYKRKLLDVECPVDNFIIQSFDAAFTITSLKINIHDVNFNKSWLEACLFILSQKSNEILTDEKENDKHQFVEDLINKLSVITNLTITGCYENSYSELVAFFNKRFHYYNSCLLNINSVSIQNEDRKKNVYKIIYAVFCEPLTETVQNKVFLNQLPHFQQQFFTEYHLFFEELLKLLSLITLDDTLNNIYYPIILIPKFDLIKPKEPNINIFCEFKKIQLPVRPIQPYPPDKPIETIEIRQKVIKLDYEKFGISSIILIIFISLCIKGLIENPTTGIFYLLIFLLFASSFHFLTFKNVWKTISIRDTKEYNSSYKTFINEQSIYNSKQVIYKKKLDIYNNEMKALKELYDNNKGELIKFLNIQKYLPLELPHTINYNTKRGKSELFFLQFLKRKDGR